MGKDLGISLSVYGRTDVGLIREHNEDNFLVSDLSGDLRTNEMGRPVDIALGERGVVLLVCDGMGGAAAGEVASQMAVETISSSMAAQIPSNREHFARMLRGSIEDANDKIYAQSRDNQNERGMGTTCTAAAIVDGNLVAGQIGDSRCYVFRNGKLGMVTKDQSLAWQLIEAGAMTHEEAKGFEHANIILQALGVQERVDVVLSQLPLCKGDILLLSSDGLHGPVSDEIIASTLINEPDLKKAGDTLIARALENEGPDNVTVVLARVDGDNLAAPDSAPVMFHAFDPGQDPADASRPRVALNEKETVEVRLVNPDHNASVPTSDDGIGTLRPSKSEHAGKSSSGSVVTFVILTLVAALAAGLYLRMERSRGLEKERESLRQSQAETSEGQVREAP